jgi:hypothetical protein
MICLSEQDALCPGRDSPKPYKLASPMMDIMCRYGVDSGVPFSAKTLAVRTRSPLKRAARYLAELNLLVNDLAVMLTSWVSSLIVKCLQEKPIDQPEAGRACHHRDDVQFKTLHGDEGDHSHSQGKPINPWLAGKRTLIPNHTARLSTTPTTPAVMATRCLAVCLVFLVMSLGAVSQSSATQRVMMFNFDQGTQQVLGF